MSNKKKFLKFLFDKAVAAVQPANFIAEHLPSYPRGKTIVIGAGKAAASMARAVEDNWAAELSGLVITPYKHSLACERIEVVEAAHPIPDSSGFNAARRMLTMVEDLSAKDLVICLLSGGGSALLSIPAEGIRLQDKQSLTAELIRSGATITEINCVRKHLSAIKGGRLAAACSPAQILTLAISDVPGNDISMIASGPTVPDKTNRKQALDVLQQYAITIPNNVFECLKNPAIKTPRLDDHFFDKSETAIIATADDAMNAAAAAALEVNIKPLALGDQEGDASKLAQSQAALAKAIAAGTGPVQPPCVLISGGETTVHVRGSGSGGRNSEYGLALALALSGHPAIYAIACDTDGIDGTENNAGCYVTPDSLHRANEYFLDPKKLLSENDSYQFFSKIGDLIVTGPTRTNVNDFRAILITDQ